MSESICDSCIRKECYGRYESKLSGDVISCNRYWSDGWRKVVFAPVYWFRNFVTIFY